MDAALTVKVFLKRPPQLVYPRHDESLVTMADLFGAASAVGGNRIAVPTSD